MHSLRSTGNPRLCALFPPPLPSRDARYLFGAARRCSCRVPFKTFHGAQGDTLAVDFIDTRSRQNRRAPWPGMPCPSEAPVSTELRPASDIPIDPRTEIDTWATTSASSSPPGFFSHR